MSMNILQYYLCVNMVMTLTKRGRMALIYHTLLHKMLMRNDIA